MPTEKCTYQGCTATFTKNTKQKARLAVQMHIGRSHLKTILGHNAHVRQSGELATAVTQKMQAGEEGRALLLTQTENPTFADSCVMNQPSDRKVLLREILRKYPLDHKGCVPWKTVFSEHPETRTKLGADTNKGMACTYAHARHIILKEPEFAALKTKRPNVVTRRGHAHAQVEAVPTGVATLTSKDISITFSVLYLPEVLHTIAFAMSGGKKAKGS